MILLKLCTWKLIVATVMALVVMVNVTEQRTDSGMGNSRFITKLLNMPKFSTIFVTKPMHLLIT
jgi:hypothetical protein